MIVSIATTAIGIVIAVIWGMSVEMFVKINGVFTSDYVQMVFITIVIIGSVIELGQIVYRYMRDNKVGLYNSNKIMNIEKK